MLYDSKVPNIVIVLKPKLTSLIPHEQTIQTELLSDWEVCNMTSIMRNTRSVLDVTDYSERQDANPTAHNSVLGIKPTCIVVNTIGFDDQVIGLTKAIELVKEKKEQKFVILTGQVVR